MKRVILKDFTREVLSQLINKFAPELPVEVIAGYLTLPPEREWGELAFPCFALAKSRRKAPVEIAKVLQADLAEEPIFEKVEALGPYVNFTFSLSFFTQMLPNLRSFVRDVEARGGGSGQSWIVEFSQPNTHKELHVGHMRNLCLGDALCRIFEFANIKVVRATYPGDIGTHVAKCLWYLREHSVPWPESGKGEWLGQIYSKAHLEIEKKIKAGEEGIKGELSEILSAVKSKKGEIYDLWLETRKWSLEQMNETYLWFGVKFDRWYSESEVDEASLCRINQWFSSGLIKSSEGALGMDLEEEGLGFFLLRKTDGHGLYATKDIELAILKQKEFQAERSFVVVDMRQGRHFAQVFAALKKAGYEWADACYHIQYNYVELPEGLMSSRAGNVVSVSEPVESMVNFIRQNYLSRYEGQWSEAEILETAAAVAQGAIRYGMVKMDNNKKIVFDRDQWLKLDGDSGPFIQYAHARMCSLQRKWDGEDLGVINPPLSLMPSERALLQDILLFPSVVQTALDQYKPSSIAHYAYQLAKDFNVFYHECPILKESNLKNRNWRKSLVMETRVVLKAALSLLGIPAPEKM